jgi:hypothetical protein
VNQTITRGAALAHAILMAAASATASAADVHTQPQVDLRVEQNDNFGLVPGGSPDSDVHGYIADAVWLVDIATPRGETTLRPRLKYQDFPDRDDLEKFEGFFDLRSRYRWERSTFDLFAHLSHQDLYTNETQGGDFDPVDPGGGGGSDSGDIIIGEVRDEFQLRPTFEHRMTERARFGVGLEYAAARYDADQAEPTKTDYDFALANGYVSWAVSPTGELTAGLYGSRYEATDNSETTDATGVLLGYVHRWSEQVGIETTLFYEENDITERDPVLFEDTTSDFGGNVTAYRRLEISEWRFSVGRAFLPTGDRGKSIVDEFRIQYDRDLSQRLAFHGAARYESRNGLAGTEGGVDRDFARLDLSLRWMVTRNWYLGGGYAYMWEDQATATQTGDNNKIYVNFGYRGLAYDRGTGVVAQ